MVHDLLLYGSGRSRAGKLPPKEWTDTYSTPHSTSEEGNSPHTQLSSATTASSAHRYVPRLFGGRRSGGPCRYIGEKISHIVGHKVSSRSKETTSTGWVYSTSTAPSTPPVHMCTHGGRRNNTCSNRRHGPYQESRAARTRPPDAGRRIEPPTAPPDKQSEKLPR